MIIQSRGIVLNSIKYGDSSFIVKIFTEELGLLSFIIRRSKSKRSNNSSRIYSKLAILDIVFNHKEKKSIHNITEASLAHHYSSLNVNIFKSSIGLFLNEIIYKSIKEEEENKPMFEFIADSLISFDKLDQGINNFHMHFLWKFTKLLGFPPQNNFAPTNEYFNMEEGSFKNTAAAEPFYMDKQQSKEIHELINSDSDNLADLKLNNAKRKFHIDSLVKYYKLHHDRSLEVSSLQVLEQVFS